MNKTLFNLLIYKFNFRNMSMKNIAIIGMGYWGKKLVYEFSKIANIKFCYSQGNISNIKWINKNYPKIKYCKNFQNILNDSTIDAIVIASPIDTHFEYALKSLKAKKHVYIEKPMCTSKKQGEVLLKIARKNNLEIFVGQIFLYHPVLVKLKKLLKNEKIDSIYLGWHRFGPFKEKLSLDLLSHFITILQELFDQPKKLILKSKIGCVTDCDILSLHVQFQKRINCVIELNRVSYHKQREIIIKSSKNLYKWEDDILLKFSKKDEIFKEYFSSDVSPLTTECTKFLKNTSLKKKNYVNTKKAIFTVSVIENFEQK